MDFGANVTLTGGLCLQSKQSFAEFIDNQDITFGSNNFETTGIGFLGKTELPKNIAAEKCTKEQTMMCFEAFEKPDYITIFDQKTSIYCIDK